MSWERQPHESRKAATTSASEGRIVAVDGETRRHRNHSNREHLALAKIEEAIGAFERWVHLSLEHLAEMTGDDLDAHHSEADAFARAKAEDHVRRWLEREAGPSA